MSQYVIQIQVVANGVSLGWLAKSFKVTAEHPIQTEIPADRVQVEMTNLTSFQEIEAVYKQHNTAAIFSQNGSNIDVTGAVTDSWPID